MLFLTPHSEAMMMKELRKGGDLSFKSGRTVSRAMLMLVLGALCGDKPLLSQQVAAANSTLPALEYLIPAFLGTVSQGPVTSA